MSDKPPLGWRHVLDYEVASSWWAPLVSWPWLQELASRYYAAKVRRKYRRYVANKSIKP